MVKKSENLEKAPKAAAVKAEKSPKVKVTVDPGLEGSDETIATIVKRKRIGNGDVV